MISLKNCIVDKVSTLKDGSVRVNLVTRALTPEQMANLFFSVNSEVMAVNISEDNKGGKSPSQRLRAVLYKLWEKIGNKEIYPEFELYYVTKMENIIDSLKDKLN